LKLNNAVNTAASVPQFLNISITLTWY